MNELRSLLVTAPAEVRDPLRGLAPVALVRACARLRPTALLRRWLLEAEQELYDVMMRPPQAPIDGRPPAHLAMCRIEVSGLARPAEPGPVYGSEISWPS